MQRRKHDCLLQLVHDLGIDQAMLQKRRAAMHDAMRNGSKRLQHSTRQSAGHCAGNPRDRICMIGNANGFRRSRNARRSPCECFRNTARDRANTAAEQQLNAIVTHAEHAELQ